MIDKMNDNSKTVIALATVAAAAAIAQEKSAIESTRKEKFKTGVFGGEMKETERNVPIDEPPPLVLNKDLRVIGKRIPRLDGKLKVSGGAKYASDIKLPGMLYAKFVSSTVPHARILSIDTSAAEKHPAVRAVHILDNVAGSAQLRDVERDHVVRVDVVADRELA